MEKYLQRTPLKAFSDHALRVLLALCAGVGWFVFLWGLSLAALTAGTALGGLLWLCARLFCKKTVEKREKAARRLLGGELALDKLLLLPPRHAAFQAALWLGPKVPMEMERALDFCVLGRMKGKRVLVRLIAQHPAMEISVQQVVDAVKEARRHEATKCYLCLTAPLAKAGARYAEAAQPEMRVVSREEMISLAGACSPATDEELSRLRSKKPRRRSGGEWLGVIFHPSRAKRYFWYGAGLSALALGTGQGFYPLPAILCLVLFAGCKLYERNGKQAPW